MNIADKIDIVFNRTTKLGGGKNINKVNNYFILKRGSGHRVLVCTECTERLKTAVTKSTLTIYSVGTKDAF